MKKAMLIVAALFIAGCGGHDPYDNIRTSGFEDGDSFTNCYLIPTGPEARSKLLIVVSGSSYVSGSANSKMPAGSGGEIPGSSWEASFPDPMAECASAP